MTSDKTHPKGAGAAAATPRDPQAAREAKLAQALRANLRRRKAEPKGRATPGAAEDDGDSG